MAPEKQSKTYSSRVSNQVIQAIELIVKVRGLSERGAVKRGLELAVEAAAKDEARLVEEYNARLQAEIDNVGTLTSPAPLPSPADLLRARSAQFEVPKGDQGVTCEVDLATHRMLETVGRWTGRNGSELVRHGLFLLFDETGRKASAYEKKLAEDFEADKELLHTFISDPSLGNAKPAAKFRKPKPAKGPASQPTSTDPNAKPAEPVTITKV